MHDYQAAIDEGALFFVSHSGGKDSQAMYLALQRRFGVPASQIVVVHADLGHVEHDGTQDHIRYSLDAWGAGHALNVVQAVDKQGDRKLLLDMVRARAESRPDTPSWPSSAMRYCTSDLKRGPLEKFIRQELKRRGLRRAVNCMGLRSEESPARRKKPEWVRNDRLSKAGREVYDWLPIQWMSTEEVFQTIADADQRPHPAYARGNERLSCVFCIFGSDNDLRNGAQARPELAAEYVRLERQLGRTMFHNRSLEERIGDLIPAALLD